MSRFKKNNPGCTCCVVVTACTEYCSNAGTTLSVSISGTTNGDGVAPSVPCTDCANIDGTYILDWYDPGDDVLTPCRWDYWGTESDPCDLVAVQARLIQQIGGDVYWVVTITFNCPTNHAHNFTGSTSTPPIDCTALVSPPYGNGDSDCCEMSGATCTINP